MREERACAHTDCSYMQQKRMHIVHLAKWSLFGFAKKNNNKCATLAQNRGRNDEGVKQNSHTQLHFSWAKNQKERRWWRRERESAHSNKRRTVHHRAQCSPCVCYVHVCMCRIESIKENGSLSCNIVQTASYGLMLECERKERCIFQHLHRIAYHITDPIALHCCAMCVHWPHYVYIIRHVQTKLAVKWMVCVCAWSVYI